MAYRNTLMILAIALLGHVLYAAPQINSLSPTQNARVTLSQNIGVTFNETMQSPSAGDMRVLSNLRGEVPGTLGVQNQTVTFVPNSDWLPDEVITVILTTAIQGSSGPIAEPFSWQFRAQSGNGPGDFSVTSTSYNSGASNFDSAVGDLDGDGLLDLAFSQDPGGVELYRQTQAGGFVAMTKPSGVMPSQGIALGDVDHDGDLDMALALKSNSTANRIFYNDGSGSFTSWADLGTDVAPCIDVEMADLNGDGHLDVIAAMGSITQERNCWYPNDGQGNFTSEVYFDAPIEKQNTWFFDTGDIDNDGDIDVAFPNFALPGSGQSWIYLNDGDGNFSSANRIAVGSSYQNTRIDLGDFDNDGWLDVALVSNSNGEKAVFLNNNGTDFSTKVDIPNGANGFTGVQFCDVNGDGNLDVYCSRDLGQDTVEINNGQVGFTSTPVNLGNGYSRYWTAAFVDLDGDDDTEAVVPGEIFYNDDGAPSIEVSWDGNNVTNGSTLQVAWNTTLSSQYPEVTVNAGGGAYVSMTAQISNVTTQGLLASEWSQSIAGTPWSINPLSGTFDQAGVTHDFTLVADNNGKTSTFTFSVDVPANSAPQLEISDSTGAFSNGAAAAGDRDFGQVFTNYLGASATFTIKNSGAQDLTVGVISHNGGASSPFTVGGLSNWPSPIAPGNSETFDILFHPQTAGVHTATVSFSHNDPGTSSPFTFEISGEGITPPPAVLDVKLGNTTLSNGQHIDMGVRGTSDAALSRTVTVSNLGSGPLQVLGLMLKGTDQQYFTLDKTNWVMPSWIGAGQSASFTVEYTSGVEAAHECYVYFQHNDGTQTSPFVLYFDAETSNSPGGSGGNSMGAGSSSSGTGGCVLSETGGHGLLFAAALLGTLLLWRRRRAQTQ